VELIEEGELQGPRLDALLDRLSAPLRQRQVDAVVLGCTHYAFVREALGRALGDAVELIDSAPAIARRTEALLEGAGLRAAGRQGTMRLMTTGDAKVVAQVAQRLWVEPLAVERLSI
jgi:glutamate racemase